MPMCLGHFRAAIPAGFGAILHAKILFLGCIVHAMLVWVSGSGVTCCYALALGPF